eukprot:5102130-Pyramimonas_sp.AAC.1
MQGRLSHALHRLLLRRSAPRSIRQAPVSDEAMIPAQVVQRLQARPGPGAKPPAEGAPLIATMQHHAPGI